MTDFQPHKTFRYRDDEVSFAADPQDIRSCVIFYDSAIHAWCAGVTVKESYTKLRFSDDEPAQRFFDAVADAKEEYAHRQAHNAALKAASRGAGA
jgi:hypothetical protein